MTDFTYDEEVYPNFFSIGLTNTDTEEYYYYEVSTRRNDTNQIRAFVDYLRNGGHRMVGFNNEGFDYPVLHVILTSPVPTLELIFGKCQDIINNKERFNPHVVWERDQFVKQIDLYKMNHYDNINKRCSLKQLEFAMRMDNIQDLPYTPGTTLDSEQMNHTASYMAHDIKATTLFYRENSGAITLRENLSETYGTNMLNFSDSKIGSHVLISKLNEAGIETHEFQDVWDDKTMSVKSKKSPKGTHRPSLCLGSVIFPNVRFERQEFQALLNWLRKTTITQTKGALSDIPYDSDLFQYMNPFGIKIPNLTVDEVQGAFKPVKNRKTRLSTVYDKGAIVDLSACQNVTSDNLNVIIDGFQYDLGTGGLHGSIESQVVTSDEEYVIADYDFASWYPHLSFMNDVYPEHLGVEFCSIYKQMYLDRKAIPKSDPNNYALKIALNGSYGNSNSVYSPFYDPKFTMTITINGQMYLCMLAEQFIKTPGLSVIQVNTDGITVRVPRRHLDHVRSVVKWIEAVTNVEMEEAIYDKMAIRDVNNYIAVYEGGKAKRKGAYQKHCDLGWHQNHSACVVAAAAEAALVYGQDIEEFIRGHKDIYDFMIMAKVNRTDKLLLGREEIQRISRVYVSKSGKPLSKIMPPIKGSSKVRQNGMLIGWLASEANDINDASFDDIDYEYYIEEAEKLVKPLLKR